MKTLYNIIMCKGLAIAAMLLASLSLYGQDEKETADNKEVLHSSMIGVGSSNILDTYLSPYNYTGIDIRIQRETMPV